MANKMREITKAIETLPLLLYTSVDGITLLWGKFANWHAIKLVLEPMFPDPAVFPYHAASLHDIAITVIDEWVK